MQDRRELRERIKNHTGLTIWLTGLSGSGKTTIAIELENQLNLWDIHTIILDGDNVRNGLNKNLGFSPEDRKENIRRIGEVAKLFREAGIVNIVAFISPYREDRKVARDLSNGTDFIEVFVDCSLAECEKRDPKGMYIKARAGELRDFTGVSAPYEPPENPDLIINTEKTKVEWCVKRILDEVLHKVTHE
jgi:adenylylsulfate kinase